MASEKNPNTNVSFKLSDPLQRENLFLVRTNDGRYFTTQGVRVIRRGNYIGNVHIRSRHRHNGGSVLVTFILQEAMIEMTFIISGKRD